MDGDLLTFDSPVKGGFESHTSPGVCSKVSAEAVRRHYDLMSLAYRLFWGEHLHHGLFLTGRESPREAQVQLLELCSTIVNIRHCDRVLDVGCGYGGTAIYLARRFRCNVDGITVSPKQARIARRTTVRARVSDRVHVAIGDVEQLNLNGQYDVIWVMESSEHFNDKAGFIRRATRLLKTKGKLIITAWTASDAHPLIRNLARLTVCPGFQTAEDYTRQLRDAGLEVTSLIDLSHRVIPTWEVIYRRVRRLRLLWPLMPAEIRSFLCAIPMMVEAYRIRQMSYALILAEKH